MEITGTYDGLPDVVGRVYGAILEEVTIEPRSKDILVKIGKRSLGKMWRWELSPCSMISGLSLILVNPVKQARDAL